jgi:hypothetical protein
LHCTALLLDAVVAILSYRHNIDNNNTLHSLMRWIFACNPHAPVTTTTMHCTRTHTHTQVRSGEIPGKEAIRQVKKRMFNRNANVVLYTLTLLEALVKNCGGPVQVRLISVALEIELVAHVIVSMFTH